MTTKTKKTIPMPTKTETEPTGLANSAERGKTTPKLSPAPSPQPVTATVNLALLNRALGIAIEALRPGFPETAKTVQEIAQQSILQERVK
jgi:hypothetical protein